MILGILFIVNIIHEILLKGQRRAKLPEGADGKSMLPRGTLAKIKMFDSCISPSGLLERLVIICFVGTSIYPAIVLLFE